MGDILSGSGYVKWCRDQIKYHLTGYDAKMEAAAIVQRGIERSGRRWLVGLDVKWTARRCVRPVKHAAALEWEAAKALSLALQLYQGAFAEATTERASAGEFDPRK